MIDFDGPVPVYRQLAAILRARIEAGDIRPGEPVPSKRAARREFGVGGHTFDRAAAVLRSEGLIETVPGRGLYVRGRPGGGLV